MSSAEFRLRPAISFIVLSAQLTGNRTLKQDGPVHRGHATPTAAARHNAAGNGPHTDTFKITIDDVRRGILTQTVTVTILPVNNKPVPKQSAKKTNSTTGVVTGSVTGTDADKDPLTYIASTPSSGSVTVTAKGAYTYTPTPAARHDAAGAGPKTDTFSITINDSHGGVVIVPVTVNISPKNTKPSATSGTPQTNTSSGVVTVTLSTSDADGDTVSFANGTTGKGSFTITGSTLTYTPTQTARDNAAKPGATAATRSDTLTVSYTDGHGGTGMLTVKVAIAPAVTTPTNAAPTANPTFSFDPQDPNVFGRLNASDPDGDALTFTISAVPARGTVEIYG
ncbi:MAG: Ig-like domain-containing protein, partial [Microbacteriaceae bacterium]